MKAGIFNGQKIQLSEISKPNLILDDEVLIKVKSSGICGSDLRIIYGKTEPDNLPIGHELSGEIVEVNNPIYDKYIGKRVAVDVVSAGRACGVCKHCLNGKYTYCLFKDEESGGSYAEYLKRRIRGCFILEDSMSFSDGALIEPLAVAVHAFRRLDSKIGENILILGSGTIGLMCLYVAKLLNFNNIYITTKYDHQKKIAEYFGADVIFDYKDEVEKQIYSDTDGLGVDISIETVGAYSAEINTLTDAVQLTKKGGQIGVVGGFRVPVEFNFLEPYIKGQSLTFPICYNYIDGKHDFDIAIDLYKKSEINISRIITGNFNFNDIEAAFDHVIADREKVIKVHLTV